jgi:hypothetical protein
MTWKQKTSFLVDTLFGMAICGIAGAIGTGFGFQFLRFGPWITRVRRASSLELGLGIILTVVLIAAMQTARVLLSLYRSQVNEGRRMELGKNPKQKAIAVNKPGRPRLLLNAQGLA